jgi:ATP-dependent helicase/nuclease subunit A
MTKPAEALPSWIANHVSPPTRPEKPLTPSDLGGTKSLPREDADPSLSEASRQFGIQLHALLEHLPNLPRDTWDTAARYLLTDKTNNPAEIDTVIQQAFTVLNTPELQLVFDVGTLAEVPVTAHLAGMGRPIYGIIDRLIVQPDRILIVDFKSNALTPDTPDDVPSGILRQMGAYADAVSQIYPDHEIQTAILWTQTATLMNLPHVLVSEALQNTTLP